MIKNIYITKNKYDVYDFIYEYLIKNYDSNIINNFSYYQENNSTFIKIKKSNIHIEYTPYNSAIDKNIIIEYINSFCSSLNNLLYKNNSRKIVIIYDFHLLYISYQYNIYHIVEKFKNYCDFILISNSIDNIVHPILNIFRVENISFENTKKKKWIKIYDSYDIKYLEKWKLVVHKIFENLIIKHNNLEFIFENRRHISLLFVTNIDINNIFLFLYDLIMNKFSEDFELIINITHLFTKYQYSIIKSTRYIIHFETLLIQIYNLINFD